MRVLNVLSFSLTMPYEKFIMILMYLRKRKAAKSLDNNIFHSQICNQNFDNWWFVQEEAYQLGLCECAEGDGFKSLFTKPLSWWFEDRLYYSSFIVSHISMTKTRVQNHVGLFMFLLFCLSCLFWHMILNLSFDLDIWGKPLNAPWKNDALRGHN